MPTAISIEPLLKLQRTFGYYARRSAHPDGADGHRRTGSDRLDGQRRPAGDSLGSAAAALQLFQAVVRPGDQSAAGRDPRGDHHLAGHHHRFRGQSARRDARAMPVAAARPADPHQQRHGARSSSSTCRSTARAARCRPCFPRRKGPKACAAACNELRVEASRAIADGVTILILSDRGVECRHGTDPRPAGHQRRPPSSGPRRNAHPLRPGRSRRAKPAKCITSPCSPATAPERSILTWPWPRSSKCWPTGTFPTNYTYEKLEKNYIKAVSKGLLKVMSKMGISTQQSYRGAQIFEAIGLNAGFIEEYFTWTPSRIQGRRPGSHRRRIAAAARACLSRAPTLPQTLDLDVGGQYQWRRKGEAHIFNPDVIAKLQQATTLNSREEFRRFCQLIDDQQRQLLTLRGLLDFKSATHRCRWKKSSPPRRSSSGLPPGPCRTARFRGKPTRRWPSP